MFGKLKAYEVIKNQIFLEFERKNAIVTVIDEGIANFKEEDTSDFAIDVNKFKEDFINPIVTYEDYLSIAYGMYEYRIYDNFKVDIYLNGLLISSDLDTKTKKIEEANKELLEAEGHETTNEDSFKFHITKSLSENAYLYGLGDKTGFLNKRNYEYDMWNTDNPAPHVDSFRTLYKTIPFYINFSNEVSYGFFFDNTYKSVFDMGKSHTDRVNVSFTDGYFNYYFIGGASVKEVVSNYTFITGRMDIPERWTLGYHQSRWSYASAKEVRELVKNFKDNDIPLECVHLDIDYMEGYRVFTQSDSKFPNFKEFIKELKDQGVKVVCIIDPGVKVDKGYKVYDEAIDNEFVATKDGKTYVNAVWPGDSVYPSFINPEVQEWWGNLDSQLLDLGVSGIWNDMNEPASFNGPLPMDVEFSDGKKVHYHDEVHNVYGHYMAKATYEGMKNHLNKRPFVITRACYAGTQKYSTVWTGDNHSIWSNLEMAIPQVINLGLSGIAFSGCDVGGFSADCTPELLVRWAFLGAVTPLFRNHSANGTRRQEPWTYDKKTLDMYRKAVKLRYELIPYMYDLFSEASQTGLPVMRPVFMEFNQDIETYQINDELMLGANILVSPVVKQGQTKKMIYLPENTIWYDFYSKEEVKCGYSVYDAPLDKLPMFVKEGSVIPMYKGLNNLDNPNELVLEIFPGVSKYCHYQDDGTSYNFEEGEYNLYEISHSDNSVVIEMMYEGYKKYDKIILRFKGKEVEYTEFGKTVVIE